MIQQFKRDFNQNSKKLHLDKYYTPKNIVDLTIKRLKDVIGIDNITEIIEPSAGNGSFLEQLYSLNKDVLAYDIEPEHKDVVKQDYLNLNIEYKKGRCVVGNPPYGSRLNLAKQFCDKSFKIADFVVFILPVSQLNNTQSIYKFDLIHSEDLGKQAYSNIEIHCCLNIYKKPKNGKFNKKISYKNSEIIEIREVVKNKNPKRNKELTGFDYDFGICAWGSSAGKECSEGEYAKTFFIKIKDAENYEYYKDLILNAKWKELYPMTNTPNLLQWQVYKYIEDNPPT